MSEDLALTLAFGLPFAYFAGRILYGVVGSSLAIRRGNRRRRAAFAAALARTRTEELRRRLLEDPYLRQDLGSDPEVKRFLQRLGQGAEVALAHEYPRPKLYRLLTRAERALGRGGRPEAADAIFEINGLLRELANRAESASGPTSA